MHESVICEVKAIQLMKKGLNDWRGDENGKVDNARALS